MSLDLERRLLVCERSNRRLRMWLAAMTVLVASVTCLLLIRNAVATPAAEPGVIRATELIVVDRAGTERVRIGGDLPDATIGGRRIDRGSKVAGVMLYDRSGQERGGYVTFDTGDNIALTLDGLKGQNALFAAGPDGSTVMQIWHGAESIELRADENGARAAHSKAGTLTWQQPRVTALGSRTCSMFRDGLRSEVPEGVPMEQVRAICGRRFTADVCDACLDRD